MSLVYLEAFSDNALSTNCWLIAAEGSDDAIVIDPGFTAARVHGLLERARKQPVAALATHGHFDHIGAAAEFCGESIPLYIHEADQPALTNPYGWGAGADVPEVPVKDVRTLVDGDVVELAGLRLDVMHTPGHTPGSVCFRAHGFVLSGDLVFAGSVGRHDLANSSPADMRGSLRRFLTLPDPLPVHPGHGPSTSVGVERASNPFLMELP